MSMSKKHYVLIADTIRARVDEAVAQTAANPAQPAPIQVNAALQTLARPDID